MKQQFFKAVTLLYGLFFSVAAVAQQADTGYAVPWREWGYPHMWGGWGWGSMILGPVMMILFWGGIIALIVVLVRWLGGGGAKSRPGKTPLDILQERFARGEIDKADYEERKRALSE